MQSCLLDVRLVCDEAHIYAHKAVLAAGSQFFLDRLQSLGPGMVELQMSTANLGMLITPSTYIISLFYDTVAHIRSVPSPPLQL